MKEAKIFWIAAVVITIACAYYQRITGPTYPVTGKISFVQKEIPYRLERSHSSSDYYLVSIKTGDPAVSGILIWKRYKTNDAWIQAPMNYNDGSLSAHLPKQPPAGKLLYKVILSSGGQKISVPEDRPVVIRFKNDVPLFVLIPHVLAMFGAMLLSTRTGLECFNKEAALKKYTNWTLVFLIAGGMVLGPITQYYAFGALWTGIPFGTDLTDNKTLIALVGWIAAAISINKFSKPKIWILSAAVLLLVVFLIPHSTFGSELDYSKMNN